MDVVITPDATNIFLFETDLSLLKILFFQIAENKTYEEQLYFEEPHAHPDGYIT
jgi:hypothetical protein